ncbi:hypothetical protein CDL60_18570 [Roseateles noduli]|nr:hypothetical protein CDL60_18570 [Roseateles noduli]
MDHDLPSEVFDLQRSLAVLRNKPGKVPGLGERGVFIRLIGWRLRVQRDSEALPEFYEAVGIELAVVASAERSKTHVSGCCMRQSRWEDLAASNDMGERDFPVIDVAAFPCAADPTAIGLVKMMGGPDVQYDVVKHPC